MKKKNIIQLKEKATCWCCDGKGCKTCKQTGVWTETHYIISDGVNAVDSDTLA